MAFCGKRRLRWPFLRRLRTSLTLRFDSLSDPIKHKRHLFQGAFVFERTGDRTLDPQIKSLLLYQLSYPPDRENLYHLSEVLTIPVPKKVLRLIIIPVNTQAVCSIYSSFLDKKMSEIDLKSGKFSLEKCFSLLQAEQFRLRGIFLSFQAELTAFSCISRKKDRWSGFITGKKKRGMRHR